MVFKTFDKDGKRILGYLVLTLMGNFFTQLKQEKGVKIHANLLNRDLFYFKLCI